ncbi:hypothetical protein BpHYR1_042629 [Brachionus plicatilis]|uniref:Uncharacterized protein n=1 Tax=Brachionus plicatilis TaxID=10195 RepID=A0A3M7T8A4_BRAPC|nr:hypothetical protein BpHYR1_042629 [Brachionus plicatilis]
MSCSPSCRCGIPILPLSSKNVLCNFWSIHRLHIAYDHNSKKINRSSIFEMVVQTGHAIHLCDYDQLLPCTVCNFHGGPCIQQHVVRTHPLLVPFCNAGN